MAERPNRLARRPSRPRTVTVTASCASVKGLLSGRGCEDPKGCASQSLERRRRGDRRELGLRVRHRRGSRPLGRGARLLALRARGPDLAGNPPASRAARRARPAAAPSARARPGRPARPPLGALLRNDQARVGRGRHLARLYGADLPCGAGAAAAPGAKEPRGARSPWDLRTGNRTHRARGRGRGRRVGGGDRHRPRRRPDLRPAHHRDEAGLLSYVEPVSASLLAWAILGEAVGWEVAVGGLAVLAGGALVVLYEGAEPAAPDAPVAIAEE